MVTSPSYQIPKPSWVYQKAKNFLKRIRNVFKLVWYLILLVLAVWKYSVKLIGKSIRYLCGSFWDCIWYSGNIEKTSRIKILCRCLISPFCWMIDPNSLKQIQEKVKNIQKSFQKFQTSFIESFQKLKRRIFPQPKTYKLLGIPKMTTEMMSKSSNQVLIKVPGKNRKKRIYFVPTYLRVKVKNFTSIDLGKLEAEANIDVIITFVYGNEYLAHLPHQLAAKLLNEAVLSFERDEAIKLSTENPHVTFKQDQKNYSITFTIRQKLHMRIQSHVYLTPFQTLNLILAITIQQLPETTISQTLMKENGQEQTINYDCTVQFNFMDNHDEFVRLDYAEEKNFGYYSLIQTGLKVLYSKQRAKSLEHFDQKVEKNHQCFLERLGPEKRDDQIRKDQTKKMEKACLKLLAQFLQKNNGPQKKTEMQQQQPKQEQSQTKKFLPKKSQKNVNPSQSPIPNPPKTQQSQPKNNPNPIPTQQPLQQQNHKPQKYFQYSFFNIPIYKHPMASLATIFLPLWSLAIINLGIFFQKEPLSDRIASIASLMIAFISLIPTIRDQIPPHPKLVFVELMVYAEIFASFLGLYHSMEVRNIQNYELEWEESWLYLTALTIFIIEVLIVAIMVGFHFKFFVPSYIYRFQSVPKNDNSSQQPTVSTDKTQTPGQKPSIDKFNHKKWRNYEADYHFRNEIKQVQKYFSSHQHFQKPQKLKTIVERKRILQSSQGDSPTKLSTSFGQGQSPNKNQRQTLIQQKPSSLQQIPQIKKVESQMT